MGDTEFLDLCGYCHRYKKSKNNLTKKYINIFFFKSCFMCHTSFVTCHVSRVTCRMSLFTCHLTLTLTVTATELPLKTANSCLCT